MRTFLRFVPAVVLILGIGAAPAMAAEKKDPEEQFKKLDANADGKLTPEEYVGRKKEANADKAKERFKKLDKDADGFLTLAEFKAGTKGA